MTRAGILLEKEPGLKTIFQGEEHPYVRCVIGDTLDPERHFECRVLEKRIFLRQLENISRLK